MADIFDKIAPDKGDIFDKVASGKGSMVKDIALSPVGALETLASQLGGFVTAPVAGLAGLAKTITSGPEAGAKTIEDIQNYFGYRPQTVSGQAANELVGKGMETLVTRPAQIAGGIVTDLTGSPLAGTAVQTPLEMAGYGALFGGPKAVKTLRAPTTPLLEYSGKTLPKPSGLGDFGTTEKVAPPKVEQPATRYVAGDTIPERGGVFTEPPARTTRPEPTVKGDIFDRVAPQEVKPVEPPVVAEGKVEHKVFNELDADAPFIRNMLDNPEYHRKNKGVEAELVWMSPSEYIEMSAKMKGSPVEREISTANMKTVGKYAREMRKLQREGGEPFPALWIERARGDQEGRHRALAAQDAGVKKVPVYVVKNVEPTEVIKHPPLPTEPKVKEPWEMSKEEFEQGIQGNIKIVAGGDIGVDLPNGRRLRFDNKPDRNPVEHTRKIVVEQALSEGKPIPPEVLKDYPDLATVDRLEAQVKGGRIGDLPKYAEGSSINLERLDTTQDVKQFQRVLTQQFEEKIGKKQVPWADTVQKARELGWDVETMSKQKDRAWTAAEIEAGRQLNLSALEQLHNKILNMPADPTLRTPEMKMEVLNMVHNYGEVVSSLSQASSEAGRALNIHKRMMASNPEYAEQANLSRVMKAILTKVDKDKLADKVIDDLQKIDMTDVKKVNEYIRSLDKPKIKDMIYEVWLNSILSSPVTHEVNILSNALTYLSKPLLETPTTALLELRKGKGRQAFFGEVKPELIGAWQGIKEGTRAAIKSMLTGESSDMWSKVEAPVQKAIPGKAGEVVRIPTKALTAADEWFKAIVYRSELNRLAYQKAMQEGARGEALSKRTAEILESLPEDMMDKARKEALYRTFQAPLGKMGNNIMTLRNSIPLDIGRFILPFVRTPTNIAKFALERTPLYLAKIIKDYRAGELTKDQLSAELSKASIGTMIGLTAYMLAQEGYITGGGPKDKTKREAMYRTGWQPYSFKIGDTYYGYNRMEPIGTILGMAADISELQKNEPFGKEDRKTSEMFGQLAFSVGKNLTSKTFLKGISSTLDAISDPQRYGESFVGNYAGSLIPTGVATIGRAMDDKMRKTEGPIDVIQSRIPGMSGKLLPKRDIWGREVEKSGTAATRALSPIPVSDVRPDKVDAEMVRLGLSPAMPGKKVRNVELTPKEYDKFTQVSGEKARQLVEGYMNRPDYPMIRDEIKKIVIDRMIEAGRRYGASQMIHDMEQERVREPIEKKYGIK